MLRPPAPVPTPQAPIRQRHDGAIEVEARGSLVHLSAPAKLCRLSPFAGARPLMRRCVIIGLAVAERGQAVGHVSAGRIVVTSTLSGRAMEPLLVLTLPERELDLTATETVELGVVLLEQATGIENDAALAQVMIAERFGGQTAQRIVMRLRELRGRSG